MWREVFVDALFNDYITNIVDKAYHRLLTSDNVSKLCPEIIERLERGMRVNMAEYKTIKHTFEPIYNECSKILILGTLPSVKSREQNFYYGHPRNRFWRLIGMLTDEPAPDTIEEKKSVLLRHGIAVWDVIAKCDIRGSSDSSIRNVEPTDIKRILKECPDIKIFANGNKAGELYRRYQEELTGREITVLPSTSPANAAYNMERLLEQWNMVKKYL